jgi:hypothetical protein
MAFVSSSRILAIVLGVAALLAALPQGSQAPWSGGLASVLWAPMRPGTALLGWARDWIRTPADPYQGLPDELRTAREDRDRLQGELDAAQLRVGQLERAKEGQEGPGGRSGPGRRTCAAAGTGSGAFAAHGLCLECCQQQNGGVFCCRRRFLRLIGVG